MMNEIELEVQLLLTLTSFELMEDNSLTDDDLLFLTDENIKEGTN